MSNNFLVKIINSWQNQKSKAYLVLQEVDQNPQNHWGHDVARQCPNFLDRPGSNFDRHRPNWKAQVETPWVFSVWNVDKVAFFRRKWLLFRVIFVGPVPQNVEFPSSGNKIYLSREDFKKLVKTRSAPIKMIPATEVEGGTRHKKNNTSRYSKSAGTQKYHQGLVLYGTHIAFHQLFSDVRAAIARISMYFKPLPLFWKSAPFIHYLEIFLF